MIGGAQHTYGPVIGAAIVIALPELLSGLAEYRVLFFGALLLIVLWIAPGGIAGLVQRLLQRQTARVTRAATPTKSANANASPVEALQAEATPDGVLVVSGLGMTFGGLRAVDDLSFRA